MEPKQRKRNDYITQQATDRQLFFVEQWLKWLPTWQQAVEGSTEEAAMIVEQHEYMKYWNITMKEWDEAYKFACRLMEVKP